MGSLAPKMDERVAGVSFDEDRLIVDLMDGRSIAVPVAWYPPLQTATPEQRADWEIAGAGYGSTGRRSTRTSVSKACFAARRPHARHKLTSPRA